MNIISDERRRFLRAAGISISVHFMLILLLGIWTLREPDLPDRLAPLTLTIESEILPAQAEVEQEIAKEERETPPATAEKQPLSPAVPAKQEQLPDQASEVKPESLQSVRTQEKSAVLPEERITAAVSGETGPDKGLNIDKNSTESFTTPEPHPVFKPKGSVIDYGDDTPVEESSRKSETGEKEQSVGVMSNDQFQDLAALLKTDTASASAEPVNRSNEKSTESYDFSLPDNVSLSFDDKNTVRRPVSDLKLEIPDSLLKKIDHDSFLTVEFTLSPEGRIIQPVVNNSSVSSDIETQVLESLRNWNFEPDPHTVKNVTGRITILFRVKRDEN